MNPLSYHNTVMDSYPGLGCLGNLSGFTFLGTPYHYYPCDCPEAPDRQKVLGAPASKSFVVWQTVWSKQVNVLGRSVAKQPWI